jgi:2-polyprenyl-3-methyl-5-hydroxy-6-metoxy-1,4-benzoquinol methylase
MGKEITYEQLEKERMEFYNKYPNLMWKEYITTDSALQSIHKKIHFLMQTQNGSDLDDYVLSENKGFAKKLKGQVQNKRVLVIGTGTGREVKWLYEEKASCVEGVTMGIRNQTFAKEVVGENVVIADMHILPWQNNFFDIIAGFQVLEHSYSPVIFLLECNRLLVTNGELHIETPSSKYHSLGDWLHHIFCPTPRQLICLMLKTGFIIEQYNDIQIQVDQDCKFEADWLDDTMQDVYIKAKKADPLSYPRGDIQRFYKILEDI